MTSRFADKMKKAASVVAEVRAEAEARADALIARRTEMKKKVDDAFAPHEALLDEHERDVEELDSALRQLSNEPSPGGTEM